MQSHDAEYRESGEGWARTPKPAAMTTPLSDTRLDMHRRLSALSRKPYGDMEAALADLLAEVDRLRAVVADHESEVVRYDADHERLSAELGRLRELLAPTELATWAGQLQSADLTPHPAFACRSATSGYEAAFQVATTDQLTDAARERLLAELQTAFDETVRRVLGYRPATTPSA